MSNQSLNVTELDHQGKRLLRLLVDHLPKANPDDPRTYLTYQSIHEIMKIELEGRTYGESLQHHGMNNLGDWTKSTQKPAITGLIINKSTNMPGEGYFKLFDKKKDDFNWWKSEIFKCKNFDWSPWLK